MNEIFKTDIDNALTRFPLLAVGLWALVKFGLPALERRRLGKKGVDETEHGVAKEVH